MRGEFIGVWSVSWRDIWSRLAKMSAAPDDLFCELYREIVESLISQPETAILADSINDPVKARIAFMRVKESEISGERQLIDFLERAFSVIKDSEKVAGAVSNKYFNLLTAFIKKYSLRYDIRPPCTLSPTLPGVFASLFLDLKRVTSKDAHLNSLMKDFENAIRDLRTDCSDGRIKTCIQKQVNLIEAMGTSCPNVTGTTLGEICGQIDSWPHATIKEALKKLYGFASNYPGIRHAGNPDGVLRAIDMRDLIAMSILLAGFTPYLTDQFNADTVYRGN